MMTNGIVLSQTKYYVAEVSKKRNRLKFVGAALIVKHLITVMLNL